MTKMHGQTIIKNECYQIIRRNSLYDGGYVVHLGRVRKIAKSDY